MGLDSRDYYRPSGGFSFFPPMIKNLLMINIAVYFIQMIFEIIFVDKPITLNHMFLKIFALIPITGGGVPIFYQGVFQGLLDASFYPWQLITYQFMHGDFMHIFFNMLMLWMFGMEIENIMGSRKFLFFYLLSGVGAGILQLLGSPLLSDSTGLTIGASGAVYGIMIAFAMYFPDRYIMFYFLIPVKAKYLITFLIVIEFISVREASIVAHLAHVGGALTALIFILIDRKSQINVNRLFRNFKKPGSNPFRPRYQKKPANNLDVEEAKFYDLNNKPTDEEINQEEIDKILDKISQNGYQGLSEREKRILFEASKKK